MPRLSIEISDQEHQRLKATAALRGQTIKQFVMSKALADVPEVSDMSEEDAMEALASFLDERMEEVRAGKTVDADWDAIRAEARARVAQ